MMFVFFYVVNRNIAMCSCLHISIKIKKQLYKVALQYFPYSLRNTLL